MGFNYTSYELGKRSANRLVHALRSVLCGDPDSPCSELAELAPYLAGASDCGDLEAALDLYFAWEGLRWAYEPRGRPPEQKRELVKHVLCRSGLPVDESFLRELSESGGLEDGGEVVE